MGKRKKICIVLETSDEFEEFEKLVIKAQLVIFKSVKLTPAQFARIRTLHNSYVKAARRLLVD